MLPKGNLLQRFSSVEVCTSIRLRLLLALRHGLARAPYAHPRLNRDFTATLSPSTPRFGPDDAMASRQKVVHEDTRNRVSKSCWSFLRALSFHRGVWTVQLGRCFHSSAGDFTLFAGWPHPTCCNEPNRVRGTYGCAFGLPSSASRVAPLASGLANDFRPIIMTNSSQLTEHQACLALSELTNYHESDMNRRQTKERREEVNHKNHEKHTKPGERTRPAFGVRELAPAFRLGAMIGAVKKATTPFLIVTGLGCWFGVLA